MFSESWCLHKNKTHSDWKEKNIYFKKIVIFQCDFEIHHVVFRNSFFFAFVSLLKTCFKNRKMFLKRIWDKLNIT